MKFFLSMAVFLMPVLSFGETLPTQSIYLQSPNGQKLPLIVEVADEPNEQKKGLMFRKSLLEGTGMLFVWPEKRDITMWMKNTYIPLDMLFIEDNVVRHIAQNTKPESLELIPSTLPVNMVLEVPAGYTKKYGVEANWQLHVVPSPRVKAQ